MCIRDRLQLDPARYNENKVHVHRPLPPMYALGDNLMLRDEQLSAYFYYPYLVTLAGLAYLTEKGLNSSAMFMMSSVS